MQLRYTFDCLHTSVFDHMGLSSSLNSAFRNVNTAVGEPAHGVDSGGLFSVMCYFLYLKHDALGQQLCDLFHVPLKLLTKCNVNVVHAALGTIRRAINA